MTSDLRARIHRSKARDESVSLFANNGPPRRTRALEPRDATTVGASPRKGGARDARLDADASGLRERASDPRETRRARLCASAGKMVRS